MNTNEQVRQASKQFYKALNQMLNGDAEPMATVWSHGSEVSAMHPIGGREIGGEAVQASWEGVAGIASEGEVRLVDQRIHVGSDLAFETGTERYRATLAGEEIEGENRVTNIYRREEGTWKMVHHHTDPDPAMQEMVRQLQNE